MIYDEQMKTSDVYWGRNLCLAWEFVI